MPCPDDPVSAPRGKVAPVTEVTTYVSVTSRGPETRPWGAVEILGRLAMPADLGHGSWVGRVWEFREIFLMGPD